MDDPTPAHLAATIGEALRADEGHWTPECVDPEVLIELVDAGGRHPNAVAVLAHLAACSYCRSEYLEMESALSNYGADEQEPSTLSFNRTYPSRSALRFNWQRLAASSSSDPQEFTGVLCDDALKFTLWLDGGRTILTAEQLIPRTDPAPKLVRYTVTSPGEQIEGYFALPDDDYAVELDLGRWDQTPDGDLDCRFAEPTELTDPAEAHASIRRCRDIRSMSAWKTLLNIQPPLWSESVQAAVTEALGHD